MSNEAKEGKYLTAEGPITLSVLNPKAIERFKTRNCRDCGNPIMSHWIIPHSDIELRSEYWCDKLGTQYSSGLEE